MNVYTIDPDTSFLSLTWDEGLGYTGPGGLAFVRQFWNGLPISNWSPPPLRPLTLPEAIEQEDGDIEVANSMYLKGCGDCPFYSEGMLFFSESAISGLAGLASSNGDLLPLLSSRFFAYNCTSMVDLVDRQESEIEYYSNGTPRAVLKYSFQKVNFAGIHLFRLNWPKTYQVFCTQVLADRIAECGLRGFNLRIIRTI